jgi:PAS domain S-box-containing protein
MKELLNENKFKSLVESLYDLIFLYKLYPEQAFEYVSPSSVLLNGYAPQDHYNDPLLFDKLVIDEDKPLFQFIRENPDMIKKPVIIRWKHKNGNIIWTEHRYINFFDDNNNIIQIGGFVRDVTERKEFEFALRDSEKKFRELFHQIKDGILLFKYNTDNKKYEIMEVNNTVCDILGFAREDFFEIKSDDDVLKKDVGEITIKIEELKSSGNFYYETFLFKKSNEEIPVEINFHKFRLDRDDVILAIIRDITDRKKLEKEILKKNRLESISILAARIAHDFNNILSAILGNISLGKFYCDNNKTLKEILLDSEEACQKAKKLVDRLITFSKGGAPIKEVMSINSVIKEAADFVLRDSNIRYKIDIANDLWQVSIDKDQISQVLNSIILNAKEAISGDNGFIEIKATNVIDLKKELIPLTAAEYIKISVNDNGCGIHEDNITKIFDPFFSTKQIGIGLGLAASYSIIKKHNGFITCESQEGKGSTFYVYLPAYKDVNILKKKQNNNEQRDIGEIKKGRILIMDDDENVRFTTGKLVEKLGFKPEFAKCGVEAIEMYKKSLEDNDPYQLVIMDLTIVDGMGGKEAIGILININPDVKVIVSSGYFNDPVIANYKEYGFKGYLNKPYMMEDLKKAIYKVL